MNTQSNQAIQTKIFGHRGYPAKFPENSLAGFRYVVAHQIDGVEFDVHLTSDRIPVIMHDETIDRTTDGTGRIVDYTLAELRQFKLSNGESILQPWMSCWTYLKTKTSGSIWNSRPTTLPTKTLKKSLCQWSTNTNCCIRLSTHHLICRR